jgi:hypothetical protein
MVQPASETECLIPVAAGVRSRLSLTTTFPAVDRLWTAFGPPFGVFY